MNPAPQAEVPAAADATAIRPPLPCRFCHIAVDQPKRRDMVKEYCSDRHRAAFRAAQVQLAIQTARETVQAAVNALGEHQARLEGALALLARYEPKKRPDRAAKPAADEK